MKNKGFTLIELLAVIVILAIIALIATPIVINMIGNSKESADERSAELYLDAVEQAVARKNLTEKFSPSTCEIQSDGNLKCDGDTLLEVQVENTRPTSGTITFEKGKIIGYNFTLGSKENVKLVPTAESCFETKAVESGIEVTKYNCGKGAENEVLDVVIPNTINGKNVVSIGNGAFMSKGLESVKIPDSVSFIGQLAFFSNKLTSIEIPSNLKVIGNSSFASNKLTNIKIPNGVTSIGDGAFVNNELTSIEIPSSVTSIGQIAFRGNKLETLKIPVSVTSIGGGAFSDNQLSDGEAFIYKRNSDGSIDNTELVSYGGKKKENVVIPNNVKIISNHAFTTSKLVSVKIPEGVTTIGTGAFQTNQLTSIEIPDSVTTIGISAFSGNALTSIKISTNLTTIGDTAFNYNQLTKVEIPSSVTSIGTMAFGNNKLTSVVVKGKTSTSDFTSFGKRVFGWATGYSDSNITFES